MATEATLSELRREFGRSRMLSMPIAGTIAWSVVGVLGAILPDDDSRAIALFISLPAIFPIAMAVSRIIGEDLFGGQRHTELDQLFLYGVWMSLLVWAIVVPFWLIEPSSLPLGAGILSGLMWIPLSWILQHWVGLFHAIARTVLVLAAWLMFPSHRFVAVPAVIVVVYLISIVALATRRLPDQSPAGSG